MPMLQKVSFSTIVPKEKAQYQHFEYSNGYGQLTKAGVTAQRGGEATADVDISMHIVTLEQSQAWFHEHSELFDAEQQSTIKGHFDEENTASAWNAIFAWGATNHSDRNYFQNAHNKSIQTTNDRQSNFVKSVSQLKDQAVQVTGHVKMVGTSFIPTTAFVFAQVSTIRFEDGSKMHVLNQSNPIGADQNGNTGSVDTTPTRLHIEPISRQDFAERHRALFGRRAS